MAADGQILVIRGGAIGDFILTLPVFSALRSRFPGIRVETVAYPGVAELALRGGLVDAVRPIESGPLAGFFADRNPSLDTDWSDYFSRFTVILSYLYDPDGIFAANVKSSTKAQFIQGMHRPDEAQDLHATSVLMQPLEQLAIFDADPVPRLSFKGDSAPAPEGPTWIAIHPGSGSETKNWPVANWIALAQRLLAETGHHLLIVGGEAEGESLDALTRELSADRVRVVRNKPLSELAVHLKAARAFIGHDSGITHLAAALGLPVLALWGPSNHTIWHPAGERVRTARCSDLLLLSVDDVSHSFRDLVREL